jgi:N-acetylgalactosamine-N,N'-diacetylbacillosaminyl-diphospho-undecaprenol 4-alpha-N-acetylgalactosaminyltransferase
MLSTGGAERVSGLLSVYFVKKSFFVHHILVHDSVEYTHAGEILNLGKDRNSKKLSWKKRVAKFRVLREFLKDNLFDFIIDTRVRTSLFQEVILYKYLFKTPVIRIIHSFNTNLYFFENAIISNWLYKSTSLVCVSKGIKRKLQRQFKFPKLKQIYNPIDFKKIEKESEVNVDIKYPFILAVARMELKEKQLDVLIKAYSESILIENNIKLVLLGDGRLRTTLQQYSKSLNVEEHVVFLGKVNNPFPYFKQALFTVLTSEYEGFPMVLLESLACETPVISYDCASGPNEIIIHRENGILIENQNFEKLVNALNELYSNEKLYYHCKSNAKTSVRKFSLHNIGENWETLFKEIKK